MRCKFERLADLSLQFLQREMQERQVTTVVKENGVQQVALQLEASGFNGCGKE